MTPRSPVAPHRQREQLWILGERARDELARGEHQPEGAHCGPEWPVRHRPAVRVHGQRRGDTEVVVGLHHRRREPLRVQRAHHLAPAGAGGHAIALGPGVDLDPASGRRFHVERHRDPVTRERLPAHRMPGGAHADGSSLGGGRPQLHPQRGEPSLARRLRGAPVVGDRHGVEPTGVVQDEELGIVLRRGTIRIARLRAILLTCVRKECRSNSALARASYRYSVCDPGHQSAASVETQLWAAPRYSVAPVWSYSDDGTVRYDRLEGAAITQRCCAGMGIHLDLRKRGCTSSA